MSEPTDYSGRPLAVNDRVHAWRDGVKHVATVDFIASPVAGQRHRDIIITWDGDDVPRVSTSDAVEVIA